MHADDPRPSEGSLILVVDDSRVNRQVLRNILERAGHRVEEAADGKEALDRVAQLSPDLILLDVVMPRMDGIETCWRLKANPETAHIPVLFVSAQTAPEDKVRGLEVGGEDYLEKGASPAEVIARVRTHLRLRRLADQLRETNRKLRRRNLQLEADLAAAAGIQRALIPQTPLTTEKVQTAWAFEPCSQVGGDIFNCFRLDEHHITMYMLDVSGHGVPAALMAVSVSQILQPLTGALLKQRRETAPYYRITPPGEVMEQLDVRQREHNRTWKSRLAPASPREIMETLDREYPMERFGMFFSIVYAVLNTVTGELRYCNAGHPPPVLVRRGTCAHRLDRGGPIIGLGGWLPFEEGRLELQSRDRLVFYTDGVTECRNPDGSFYGEERFLASLEHNAPKPLSDYVTVLMEDLGAFASGEPAHDDISLFCLEYTA